MKSSTRVFPEPVGAEMIRLFPSEMTPGVCSASACQVWSGLAPCLHAPLTRLLPLPPLLCYKHLPLTPSICTPEAWKTCCHWRWVGDWFSERVRSSKLKGVVRSERDVIVMAGSQGVHPAGRLRCQPAGVSHRHSSAGLACKTIYLAEVLEPRPSRQPAQMGDCERRELGPHWKRARHHESIGHIQGFTHRTHACLPL